MKTKLFPQYKIFYSWQSDNVNVASAVETAIKKAVKNLSAKGYSIKIEQGGGGLGFISIEDAVRMKIQSCDLFIGDVTPVGKVKYRKKVLPNSNVLYEMGVATEVLSAERIIAVAVEGISSVKWRVEDMPFDFNHYGLIIIDPSKPGTIDRLVNAIEECIETTNRIAFSRIDPYLADWLVNRNIKSGKYLPDTFLEDRDQKDKARCLVMPSKMYQFIYDRLDRMSFSMFNEYMRLRGKNADFSLKIGEFNLANRSFDLFLLREKVGGLKDKLEKKIAYLDKDGNKGWRTATKLKRQLTRIDLMNRRMAIIKSDAGHGKTNFLCDIVKNVLQPEHIPYVFVNAYELSEDRIAESIALEHNYIGNGSLEDVILKIEQYCNQHRKYMILVIDGLNEHPKQKMFKNNLVRVLRAIRSYQHVKVLMSCRNDFYNKNYQLIRDTFGEDAVEIMLNWKSHPENMSDHEKRCIIERYMNHFEVKGSLHKAIVDMLIDKPLFMRLFFETHNHQDVSRLNYINREEVYSKYFDAMCNDIQRVFEQDEDLTDRNLPRSIVFHLIDWMLKNGEFKNLPYEKVQKSLPVVEKKFFSQFINSNILIQRDTPHSTDSEGETLNFSYEEIRDYLIARYLVDTEHDDTVKFKDDVSNLTDSLRNTAESVRRFLFLIVRNRKLEDHYKILSSFDWFKDVYLDNIWYIADELITDEDIEIIKSTIKESSSISVKTLATDKWNPDTNKKLNITVLIDVFESLSEQERRQILESVWSKKVNARMAMLSELYQSEMYKYVKMVGEFIVEGIEMNKEHMDLLIKFLTYFKSCEGDKEGIVHRTLRQIEDAQEMAKLGYLKETKKNEAVEPNTVQYDTFRYLMPVHSISREDFILKAGAKGGFASEMFGSIYDAIFVEADDVWESYNTYYKQEYKSFEHFISMHYNIPMEASQRLSNIIENKDNKLIDFSSVDFGSDEIEQFVFSDDMYERFYDLIKYKEHED